MGLSTKRNLREVLDHLVALRSKLRVKGQWITKPALADRRFRRAGVEVLAPHTGQSVMTLMQGDVSEHDPKDIEYLVQLHNAVPEISSYTLLLEAQVCRARSLLLLVRNTIEEAATGEGEGVFPADILDRLDVVLEETGRHVETAIPETPHGRRRAIRMPPHATHQL